MNSVNRLMPLINRNANKHATDCNEMPTSAKFALPHLFLTMFPPSAASAWLSLVFRQVMSKRAMHSDQLFEQVINN